MLLVVVLLVWLGVTWSLRPLAISSSARDLKPPSLRISLKCANRSLPPDSGVMKPKPLPSSNHLTMPVCVVLMSAFP